MHSALLFGYSMDTVHNWLDRLVRQYHINIKSLFGRYHAAPLTPMGEFSHELPLWGAGGFARHPVFVAQMCNVTLSN